MDTMSLALPDYEGGGIVNLAASILSAFDVAPPSLPCREELLPAADLCAGSVVLLVCDALGLRQLERALDAGVTPNLASLIERAPRGLQRLTSVFPTTTTAALTSLSTACSPSRHGMLGLRQWLDEMDSVCDMLRFRTESGDPVAFDEEVVRAVPTMYELMASHSSRVLRSVRRPMRALLLPAC